MNTNVAQELKVIISHKQPTFKFPANWHVVTTDPNNKTDFFVEDDAIWSKKGDFDCLSEYSTLIPLAKKLKTMPEIKTIRIAQYRKIVSNLKILNSDYNPIHNFFMANPTLLKIYNINKIVKPIRNNFLISSFYSIPAPHDKDKTIYYHYEKSHHIEDLLNFLSDAVACGIISHTDTVNILNLKKLLMAGIAIGVFPTDIFVNILEKTEKIANYHYENSWIKRNDNYQYRNLGFLLEILTGYFLINELKSINIDPQQVSGYLTVINEEQQYVLGKK